MFEIELSKISSNVGDMEKYEFKLMWLVSEMVCHRGHRGEWVENMTIHLKRILLKRRGNTRNVSQVFYSGVFKIMQFTHML